jgi:hypothetical protein
MNSTLKTQKKTLSILSSLYNSWSRYSRDHMVHVVGFTTTCAISVYHVLLMEETGVPEENH